MRTIERFTLPVTPVSSILAPEGARIVHVAVDRSFYFPGLAAWAEVDTDRPVILHPLRVVATGQGIPDDYLGTHVGTVIEPPHVRWHVYKDLIIPGSPQ